MTNQLLAINLSHCNAHSSQRSNFTIEALKKRTMVNGDHYQYHPKIITSHPVSTHSECIHDWWTDDKEGTTLQTAAHAPSPPPVVLHNQLLRPGQESIKFISHQQRHNNPTQTILPMAHWLHWPLTNTLASSTVRQLFNSSRSPSSKQSHRSKTITS